MAEYSHPLKFKSEIARIGMRNEGAANWIVSSLPIYCIAIVVFISLYFSSLYNYLLFHSLVELFAVIIASSIFIMAWNARGWMGNHYLLFIGIAYLFVGALDLVHLFSYEGMYIIQADSANTPTQFWIAARYLQSLSLLFSPLMLGRRISIAGTLVGYGFVCTIILFAILDWDVFPVCYQEGTGLTPFKKISEYVIALILLVAGLLLYRLRARQDPMVIRWLLWSIAFTIVSEITFTEYAQTYDFTNLIGHFLKIVSFYCIYKAIIEAGLKRPYAVLFHELKRSEQALQRASSRLEEKVQERTMDLQATVRQLSREIKRRMKAECMFRRLSRKSIDALEKDRKSVAKEVHDNIGASLATIKYQLEDVLSGLAAEDDTRADNIKKSVFYLADTIQEARHISARLRPLSLEELGLLPTMKGDVRTFNEKYKLIEADLQIEVEEEQVPEPMKIVIYRIMQEALNNVGKHSKATAVLIHLKATGQKIQLKIKDNGKGFGARIDDHTQIDGDSDGIQNMCERTELIGGHFSFSSVPNQGTNIETEFPLHVTS